MIHSVLLLERLLCGFLSDQPLGALRRFRGIEMVWPSKNSQKTVYVLQTEPSQLRITEGETEAKMVFISESSVGLEKSHAELTSSVF